MTDLATRSLDSIRRWADSGPAPAPAPSADATCGDAASTRRLRQWATEGATSEPPGSGSPLLDGYVAGCNAQPKGAVVSDDWQRGYRLGFRLRTEASSQDSFPLLEGYRAGMAGERKPKGRNAQWQRGYDIGFRRRRDEDKGRVRPGRRGDAA